MVRAQLLTISGATIDRPLKPTKDADRPGVHRSGHGRPLRATLAGEFARTLTATDVFTGWTENVAVRIGAHKWVLEAMDETLARLPFPLVGLDTDNGGEFINHALIRWAGERDISFTRSRPYKSNGNAHVKQKQH